MISHGTHIVEGGLLISPRFCWMLIHRIPFQELLEVTYLENLDFHEVVLDMRTVALQGGPAELSAEADGKPVTVVAQSRNSPEHSQMLNADQAAAHLNLKPPAVRKAAREGRLPGSKLGLRGDWVFTMAAVRAFAESRAR